MQTDVIFSKVIFSSDSLYGHVSSTLCSTVSEVGERNGLKPAENDYYTV